MNNGRFVRVIERPGNLFEQPGNQPERKRTFPNAVGQAAAGGQFHDQVDRVLVAATVIEHCVEVTDPICHVVFELPGSLMPRGLEI